jgi:hypothetical protein
MELVKAIFNFLQGEVLYIVTYTTYEDGSRGMKIQATTDSESFQSLYSLQASPPHMGEISEATAKQVLTAFLTYKNIPYESPGS